MTKPSRRSSVASALFRARPLRLALPALAVLVGFGLFVSGCGDDPAPTTPTPAPTPTPTPTPPPAVPTGLTAASTGPDYIEWTWTAVEGATAYDVQVSNTAENDFTQNTQSSVTEPRHRAGSLSEETTRWARVRAKSANGESDWSDAVSGTTMKAPLVLTAPGNVRVADRGSNFIEWTWNPVEGASGYQVEMSLNDTDFTRPDSTLNPQAEASPKARFTVAPDTTAYVRVRAFAGEGTDRMEGPWSPSSRGMSTVFKPGIPTGLEVTERGADYLVFSWNEVDGATGYTAQIDTSPPHTFNPPSATLHPTGTSQRFAVTDTPPHTAHVRVRANAGTNQSQRGDWSESVAGTTVAPEPEPIATPTGLAASGATRSQVSLDWNDVTNAETYEVQQRAGSSGSWGNATCDESDDNEVEDSECTVTGLESGTAYQFHVRAVPVDDDDDLLTESAWSSAVSATTTGRTMTGSGSGDLNVRWRSNVNSITWTWDQASGADFDTKLLGGVQDAENPCATRAANSTHEVTQFANSLSRATKLGGTNLDPSDTLLLCVRTTETEGTRTTKGEWSHSWAVTAPPTPTSPMARNTEGDLVTDHTISHEVETLIWGTAFSNQPQFDYEFAYILDEREKTTDDWPSTAPTGAAAQRRCSAAAAVASRREETSPGGATTPTTFESTIDLEPHSRYLMCYRAVNETGRSDWAFNFGEAGAVYTTAAPPTSVGRASVTPGVNTSGVATPGETNFRLSWRVTVSANAPKADDTDAEIKADYQYAVVHTTGDDAATAADQDDVVAVCNFGTRAGLQRIAQPGTSLFQNVANSTTQFDVWHVFGSDTATKNYYLCVRTLNVSGNVGRGGGLSLWTVSPAYSYRTPS